MLHELYLDKCRFFVSKLDRQPMCFERMSLWLYTLSILWEEEMPFESKLTGFKSLTCRFCFKDICIYLFEKSCVCYIVFLIIASFFFGGALSLWKNLWDKVILQLCFVHLLLVPSGNWLALNIICGLVVMEFAYVL